MFTEKDLEQIQLKGISEEKVLQQIENFKQGFPFMEIVAPATPGNGLLKLSSEEVSSLETRYEKTAANAKVVKFVPASGAASRMFKALFSFADTFDGSEKAYQAYLADSGFNSPQHFITNLSKFAFYSDLNEAYLDVYGKDLPEAIEDKEFVQIIKLLLGEEGLNYGAKPKGLLKFHNYDATARTPLEEHLVEAALYAQSGKQAHIHFTVSGEHKAGFTALTQQVLAQYEKDYGITFEISYSEQKAATDTVAVTPENTPFRNSDQSILFRPGGHGALIENLNDIDADIIFVKNIDNVVPDSLKKDTVTYKKVIAGVLLSKQEQIFDYLNKLEAEADEALVEEILDFLEVELFVKPAGNFDSFETKLAFVREKLDRPVRVCGMVKNEGEPGGGPFWCKNHDGSESLQIVESSQIDPDSAEKAQVVSQATHFNPVDLVCGVKNHKGEKYDLPKFVDHNAGFISSKSKDGKDLKALELPGLWNGAMSNWNTFFVEVPLATFNPVKTVNDLLRDTHQA